MGRVSAVIASIACLAAFGAAHAQVPRGFTPQGADAQRLEGNRSLSAAHYQSGVEAVQSKNFQVAEGIFDEILDKNPNHADANFYMGITKMSLNKWEDAKKYLDVAVRKKPREPGPKSLLGVTLTKLGDMDGAMKQRADLEKMDKDCKGKCRGAEGIASSLSTIDAALPARP